MLCRDPYVNSTGQPFGCGQCLPCRLNKRRVWTHRIMLEAAQYDQNCFLTLTYREEELPEGGSLAPSDYRNWLKRLRFAVEPSRFRYFIVGEYGDQTFRPHFHAALFGFPTCKYGRSRYDREHQDCCHWCDLVRDTWKKGLVDLGELNEKTAQYISEYVCKKMTGKTDERLQGRLPEFARMSLRPGLGFDACWDIADALMRYEGDASGDDPSNALSHGRRVYPLGRYLHRQLRRAVGRSPNAPQAVIDKIASDLLPHRLAARASSLEPGVKAHLVRSTEGKYQQLSARERIFKQGRKV